MTSHLLKKAEWNVNPLLPEVLEKLNGEPGDGKASFLKSCYALESNQVQEIKDSSIQIFKEICDEIQHPFQIYHRHHHQTT